MRSRSAAADELVALAREARRRARHVSRRAVGRLDAEARCSSVLAARRDALPWDRVELWWGDERTVPPDHPDSNYGMAKQHLIDPLGLDRASIAWKASAIARRRARYERALFAALGDAAGVRSTCCSAWARTATRRRCSRAARARRDARAA